MSAEARNYAYRVKITDPNKKENTLSKELLQQYRTDVEKYLKKSDGNKT